MELDFHRVRTHWNRGFTALCCRGQAQHAPHQRPVHRQHRPAL